MSFENENQEVITTIDKNSRGSKIVVAKIIDTESGELKGIDIRENFTNDGGYLVPTRKGIRLSMRILKEVVEALNTVDFSQAEDSSNE